MPALSTSSKISWSLVDLSEDTSIDDIPVQVPFMIGRRQSADLPLGCISVSGKHAELFLKGSDLWINDLQSTNGTFVNGTRISESTQLNVEDIVQFGSIVFKVGRQVEEPVGNRSEMQTVESDIPESAQGRFARLLRVGVVPFFQPVFDLTADEPQLTGYEVLGRGRLPGLCTPDEMFAAAKEMEKTAELSESLRKRGIEVADANFSSGKMIFVNTHPSEISSDRLGESLARIRSIHPDRKFTIELPAAILQVPESMSVIEAATQGMNIDLSIYGFQADSIRLADLHRLAPKVVKFSNSLIRDIQNADSAKQKLIASMVKMLAELDIQPMAELVETAEEHETLKRLGVQLAQGFYYGRPSSIDDCKEVQNSERQESKSEPVSCDHEDADSAVCGSEVDSSDANVCFSEADTTETSRSPKSEKESDSQWVLSQPADNYTLQIMATTSKTISSDYINQQDEPNTFLVVPGMGTRRHLFSVFHGSFNDRDAAKAVAKQLKDSNCCPLVRRFKSVQAEVKKALSSND